MTSALHHAAACFYNRANPYEYGDEAATCDCGAVESAFEHWSAAQMTGADWLAKRGYTIWLAFGGVRLGRCRPGLEGRSDWRRADTPLGGPDRGCEYRPLAGNRDSILRDGVDLQFGEPAIRDKGGPLTDHTGTYPMRGLATIVERAVRNGGLT